MRNKNKKSSKRLEKIRNKVEKLIAKNQDETGTGKSIGAIEGDLLRGVLEVGELLLEDRIEREEGDLEERDYEVQGKKSKKPRLCHS